ncbi:unnamed protein product [Closterium sp. NIES-54]
MTDIVRADGHMWLKYGQKNIHNTSTIRCYYKCYSSKNKPPCRAKKTVDYDRRLPISSSTTNTKYSNRSHNHSIPLNHPNDAIAQGSCPSHSAESSSCNPTAVVTTDNSLASPPSSAGTRPEPYALASNTPSSGELPIITPASCEGVVSSSLEPVPVRPDSLSNGAELAIAANRLPQIFAFSGSSESAALTLSSAIPPSLSFSSCESLPTESGNLSHLFTEADSLGGRWPCAEKRVRLTPSDEATSTEDTSNSAGYHWLPSTRVFETLSADLDQMLYPEPCSPPTADAAADDVSFGLPLTGVSFEDGLVAASPEELWLAHADISFLPEMSPKLCSDSFWYEEPPWLEAADVSPSWGASGWSDGSSSDDGQEPHLIHLKRSASAMLPGTTEAGILDGSNPGYSCVPWPMPKSSSTHSVFSFLGGGDTLSVSDLMKH